MLSPCKMIINDYLFIFLAVNIVMPCRVILIRDIRINVNYLPIPFISKE